MSEPLQVLQVKTTAIILAAGQGTRMKSALPKVLHRICGKPLVYYPVQAAFDAGCHDVVVVVGHGRQQVEAALAEAFGDRVRTALQVEQRGTGDAARAGLAAVLEGLPDTERVLLFYGDVPLLSGPDVRAVAEKLDADPLAGLALATCSIDNPQGYGRVLRDPTGQIVEIREQKDLKTDDERAVREINPGIYASSLSFLSDALGSLTTNNAQNEYYLTDIVSFAASSGKRVVGVASRADVMEGVNDRTQLCAAEEQLQARILRRLRLEGVTVREGARVDSGVVVERDAVVESYAVLRGATRVGAGAVIDVGCVLTDVVVEAGAHLKPYTVATRSSIGAGAQIGPFSHLRPESTIGEEAHVGNFVETKKTTMAKGAKANHLAYLGDGVIGAGANIGAGTIFCNYDGFQKHTTTIGAGAFIGSDSQLVAPVTVGEGAYVATGTTVTKSVPADALAIARVKQENKEGYAAKLRGRMKAAKEAAAKK
ncbi:MAG: bifunctional UDP-N-acetylglucosamine diphosphorylase/glucosamine-1-phosphate N-acetyltransferase GlmU [Myxococcales bacterium]|jgi:bifunctional UDP-N-acetylglucosamine pyrophosphorylase/glucosamine-1-phosphate N-acetyltransferase|nr:bifunctional UDP-N-acetylglucosamine diphosphorylase/glucosamine-1-phosphate N-acetyltransferase GlmU [Myxococcales bacterium]MBL0196434.1 bifunctional UDP-N-acetylglucosamine diphosphorylase/glucosamine-1-phosphate N-acetyltransferase GlmU [Myxococcales bacterium]HQY64752.1 bifunctional UDP-N-acetylglucosamine diphosphorylase/glucosamine-1-phosphate N-acetyltransferase GlmU [Polyangiaceae bacterium]